MPTAKINNDLIGIAGVHFVAYRLSLRGLIALPTIRNTAGMDLLVCDPATGKESAVQVKASQKKVPFWPTSTHTRALKSANGVYVFLRYLKSADTFEAFLEPAAIVAAKIQANEAAYKAKGHAHFPYWDLPDTPAECQRLIDAWNDWKPV